MGETERRYLVLIQLGRSEADIDRIQEAVPGIQQTLDDISNGDCQFAFASHDGSTFGFLLRSRMDAHDIRVMLETNQSMRNGDSILVLEAGRHFSGTGFSRAGAWLQHH